jgi:hypothetical protein
MDLIEYLIPMGDANTPDRPLARNFDLYPTEAHHGIPVLIKRYLLKGQVTDEDQPA